MNHVIEISKAQQSVFWRPHLLTSVMEHKELSDLLLEPVINPSGSGESPVTIESSDASVKWKWGSWSRVEIAADQTDASSEVRTYLRSQPAEAKWNELPAGREVELTFHGSNGALARAKVEVPDLADFGGDVTILPAPHNRVKVQIDKAAALTNVVVMWLRLGMEGEFRPQGQPFEFPQGLLQAELPMPNPFFGIVAVVANEDNSRRLVAAADFDDRGNLTPKKPGDAALAKVRRWMERRFTTELRKPRRSMSTEEWLSNWPSNSQLRFRSLYNRARQHFNWTGIAGSDDLLRSYATGLARYLALIECGHESSNPQKLVRQLNDGSFQMALNTAQPFLGRALEALKSPAEIVWAVRHAGNRNLPEVASVMANQGVGALARELHLVDKRLEAVAAWQARMRPA